MAKLIRLADGRLAGKALALAGLCLALAPGAAAAQTVSPPYAAAVPDLQVHAFHEVYYAQSHNTYAHGAAMTGWLEHGIRSLEIDVSSDDWRDDPLGPYVSHDGPSGKWNCNSGDADDRLGHCLTDIMDWLGAHPESEPVLVLVDMKRDWDGDDIARLDDWIRDYTAQYLYRYEELITWAGFPADFPRALIRDAGWPTLSELKGKLIIGLTGGTTGAVNQGMEDGLLALIQDYGRQPATFFCPDVESDPEELDVWGQLDGMSMQLSQYFLCSNLKSRDHYQITANRAAANKQIIHLWGDHVYGNNAFNYNYVALAHGIQVIGRDLNDYSDITTFGGAIPLVGLRRSLPGYFRLRSDRAPALCMGVDGGYGNGSDIRQEACSSAADQQFVYTAEGQLRPRGNNTYCVDINGGAAGQGKQLHLWDCDGGSSEKWVIGADGHFASYSNTGYCMDSTSSTTAGQDWRTAACSAYSSQQLFHLEAVPDWNQTSF